MSSSETKQRDLLAQLKDEVNKAQKILDNSSPWVPPATPWQCSDANSFSQRPLAETDYQTFDGGYGRAVANYVRPQDAPIGQYELHDAYTSSIASGRVIEMANQIPRGIMSWAEVDPSEDVNEPTPVPNPSAMAQPRSLIRDYDDSVYNTRYEPPAQPKAPEGGAPDPFIWHARVRNAPGKVRDILVMCRKGGTPSYIELNIVRDFLLEGMMKKSKAIVEMIDLMEQHLEKECIDLIIPEQLRMNIEYFKINNELPGLCAERKAYDVRPSESCVHIKGACYKELDEITKEDVPNTLTVDGEFTPSKYTIKWLRSHVRGYTLDGKTELANKIVTKFGEWFGQKEVDRAITDAFIENLRVTASKSSDEIKDNDGTQDWADGTDDNKLSAEDIEQTKTLIHHMKRSDVPGLTAEGSCSAESITWLRWLFVRAVKANVALQGLILKCQQMFSSSLVERIFSHPMIQKDISDIMQPRILSGECEIPVWYDRYVKPDALDPDANVSGGIQKAGYLNRSEVGPLLRAPRSLQGPRAPMFDDYSVTPGMAVGGPMPYAPTYGGPAAYRGPRGPGPMDMLRGEYYGERRPYGGGYGGDSYGDYYGDDRGYGGSPYQIADARRPYGAPPAKMFRRGGARPGGRGSAHKRVM